MVDPQGAQAHAREAGAQEMILRDIFNPAIGKYEVRASEGPNFGTRMQAANQALLQLITQAPNLTPIIGDLILSSSNWPMSDEAAERLKRMVPPQALGAPPPQEIQQLQQQLQQAQALIQKLTLENGKHKLAAGNKLHENAIAGYNAETQRIKVTGEQINDANELQAVTRGEVQQMMFEMAQQQAAQQHQMALQQQAAQAPQTPPTGPTGAPQ